MNTSDEFRFWPETRLRPQTGILKNTGTGFQIPIERFGFGTECEALSFQSDQNRFQLAFGLRCAQNFVTEESFIEPKVELVLNGLEGFMSSKTLIFRNELFLLLEQW